MNPQAPHGPDGKLVQTIDSVNVDARACELRSRGWSYLRIGEELGIDGSAAYERVQRGIARVINEPAEAARQFELERLDRLWIKAEEILEAEHIVVQHGKIVYDPDTGSTLTDHTVPLQAIGTLLKVQERRAKLLGLDAATKTQVSGGVRYEVVGVDVTQLT